MVILIVLVTAIGVYEYYQLKQEELIRILIHYQAYNPNFKYEEFAALDVDSLPKPNGNLTFRDLIIAYTFNSPDEYDSVPYLKVTYLSGPACNVSQSPSSVNCHEMLLIIPENNVNITARHLYAGPLNSFGFDLNTETGEHITWHLYLFLLTYIGTNSRGFL